MREDFLRTVTRRILRELQLHGHRIQALRQRIVDVPGHAVSFAQDRGEFRFRHLTLGFASSHLPAPGNSQNNDDEHQQRGAGRQQLVHPGRVPPRRPLHDLHILRSAEQELKTRHRPQSTLPRQGLRRYRANSGDAHPTARLPVHGQGFSLCAVEQSFDLPAIPVQSQSDARRLDLHLLQRRLDADQIRLMSHRFGELS